MPDDEYVCFKATSDGWLTIDMGSFVYIESIRLTYPEDSFFDMKFSSTGDELFSTEVWDNGNLFGFVEMINREEEFI